MAKRKDLEDEEQDSDNISVSDESSSEESGSDEDANMLDVEFEWFDPQPEHDFHGVRTLLRQLFDSDAQLFDLTALTNLILAQPLLGSTVKVEGNESDPYAFLSVLNLHEHSNLPVISKISMYLSERAHQHTKAADIQSILQASHNAKVGLILTERLINVPFEVVPPMYKMLVEEISWALEEKEPYDFSHYLIISKTYREISSSIDEDGEHGRKRKKQKKDSGKSASEMFYFHPEDELLHEYASAYSDFEYKSEASQSDSKRTFQELGIKPQGHVILIEAGKFGEAVKALEQYFG